MGRGAETGGICVYFSSYSVAGSSCCCHFSIFCSVELLHGLQKSLIVFQGIKKKTHRSHTIFFLLPADTYLSSRDVSLNISSGKINEVN